MRHEKGTVVAKSKGEPTGHVYVDGTRLGLPPIMEVGVPVYGVAGEKLEGATKCANCREWAVKWNASWAFVCCHFCGERP